MGGKCREGCKARVVASKAVESNNYIISWFTEKDNHMMSTLNKVHLVRSHRIVTESKKVFNRDLGASNISTNQQMSLLKVQVRGMKNIGCTSKDLYNWERQLHAKLIRHDAELLKEHFLAERKKNDGFYFKMKEDSYVRLANCFWQNATSRRSYGYYEDVVVFDTMYNTNRYSMVFAPLIGLNNHGQAIVSACSFSVNETEDSFIWLFEEFKKAMLGSALKMIITDQDTAIAKTIVQSLLTTFHRYCIWHIMNKFSEKLNSRYNIEELHNCI
ncbi:PREDICTED: FAR1-RELATED SEQUENCE [Prunus dulcis]|uniref:PREDICTED: FAR1-RELATED SEQUENCE n=1 Tax=Prunus dulcis TaxID=3755 RepID=A0A5E4GFG4_PRUDU|nr:PREDICTED: FAR1-RELATED SEQUENCE [Prunus dulcis]